MSIQRGCESVNYVKRALTLRESDLVNELRYVQKSGIAPSEPTIFLAHLKTGDRRMPAYLLNDGRDKTMVKPEIVHQALLEIFGDRVARSEAQMPVSLAAVNLLAGYRFPEVLQFVTDLEIPRIESTWYFPGLLDKDVAMSLRLMFKGHFVETPTWWLSTFPKVGLDEMYTPGVVRIRRRELVKTG